MERQKIVAPNYIKGHEFTDGLKKATGCSTLMELSEVLDVPKATFSAWNLHERTSHELIIRLHLVLGIPIAELALDEEAQKKLAAGTPYAKPRAVDIISQTEGSIPLARFGLVEGKLVEKPLLNFDKALLEEMGVRSPMAVTTENSTVIIDKETDQAVSGTYLVDMDGLLSLNDIQRLPGKQLAISFAGSVLTVDELSVKIVGKVVLDLRKG
ncbi:helix-turn-helix domain-containing protein [Vibrio sp. DW001]|uniref:helix-turn-helix domain-containing protein n=1 Tax=Vibrio sp. DW001 TaxID=2912315 RepID=UPI0023B1F44A|nr:helix-turn-helix domain-containing protein [Vibrio sp. DW001]WED29898.1 helix-turn-helix domain-containing protein [Vibrio sp. DW001]